jgi:catechol 2,3-dioxygenase-like lactoylglutathione lyase family enzyme
MSDTQTQTNLTQVGTCMIPVKDQDQAIAFYTEKLGFELRADIPLAGAATTLALTSPRPGEATGIETRIALSTTDIDADHADLKARGVDVDAEVMRMGDPVPPMFWFNDPEGNRLLIVQTS